ncbi:putative ATPase [Planctomycetales bacterium 10988]|nr:putative ATPase [Planctomycetales bacterium 10988]
MNRRSALPDINGGMPFPHLPRLIEQDGIICPEAPSDVYATGISASVISDICLKAAYTVPQCTSEWVAGQLHLQMPLVDDLLQQMKIEQLVEVLGQLGPFNHRYAITERGRERARRLLEVCGYIGPAPVSIDQYTSMLDWQISQFPRINLQMVRDALEPLVVPEEDLYTAGLAAMSGRSLFLSGPPGNGKTSIARLLHDAVYGDLWIPFCIGIGNDVIRVYDPQCHELSEMDLSQPWKIDQRWVRIQRPLIVAGGEMTIEALDLSFSPALKFYEAPLHFKSNGGTFVIDDFGRQRVAPSDLLNRWIIPLEHRIDYMTLHTGLKVQVPFRQLLIVATNLDPNRVMDPAFLRRMGYRIEIQTPTIERYREIFIRYAKENYDLTPPQPLLERLLDRYKRESRELRACEPRDLIERVHDICLLRREAMDLNDEYLDLAWCGYFGTKRKQI